MKLYRPVEGRKDHVGVLMAYDGGNVTVGLAATETTFEKKDVAQVRLYVRF